MTSADEVAEMAAWFGDAYLGLQAMADLALSGPGVPVEIEFGLDLILERQLASGSRRTVAAPDLHA